MSEKKKAAGVPGRDKTNKAKINEKNDEKSGQSRLFHKFEPIFDENSRILILGTFPSVKSREQDFYYAHPRNRFWNILSKLTQEPLPVTKEEKIELLLRNRIALWDVKAVRLQAPATAVSATSSLQSWNGSSVYRRSRISTLTELRRNVSTTVIRESRQAEKLSDCRLPAPRMRPGIWSVC